MKVKVGDRVRLLSISCPCILCNIARSGYHNVVRVDADGFVYIDLEDDVPSFSPGNIWVIEEPVGENE